MIERVKAGVVSAPVINAIMTSFKPEYISKRAMMFASMIKDCEESGLPKVDYFLHTDYNNVVEPPIIRPPQIVETSQ